MAQRRMYSTDIVESDAFLEMPISSQALYFHLGMYADDDGFVQPKKIMRLVGASDDDIKVLISKRFILPFQSGVVIIKHWLIHNLIRADLYKETMYKDEKKSLGLNENGAYTELREGIRELKQIESPEWLKRRRGELRTASGTLSYRNRCVRLGKDRIGKVRLGKDIYIPDFESFWSVYPRKTAKKMAEKAFKKLNPNESLLKEIISAIEKFKMTDGWRKDDGAFIPYPATFLNGQRWEDEIKVNNQSKQLSKYDNI